MTQDDIRKLLWEAADNLRIHLDAATYKHPVLGLIFLKYVSDRFELRRSNLDRWARDPESEYDFRKLGHRGGQRTTAAPCSAGPAQRRGSLIYLRQCRSVAVNPQEHP